MQDVVTSVKIKSHLKMSFSEAYTIQQDQLDYYSRNLTDEGKLLLRQKLDEATTEPEEIGYHDQVEMSTINRMVPRGTWFESKEIIALMDKYTKREPWQMTREEWFEEWEKTKIDWTGSQGVPSSDIHGKHLMARIKRQSWLKCNLPDIDVYGDGSHMLPVRHYHLIKWALGVGKPVPYRAVVDYDDCPEIVEKWLEVNEQGPQDNDQEKSKRSK